MVAILLFLHILCFAVAFMLTAGVGLLLKGVVASGASVRTIDTLLSVAKPLQVAGGILYLVTGALGVWLAAKEGFVPNTAWLIGVYLAYAVLIGIGLGIHAPWGARVSKLARADAIAGDAVSPELAKALRSPMEKVANRLMTASLLVLTYLMIVKPD